MCECSPWEIGSDVSCGMTVLTFFGTLIATCITEDQERNTVSKTLFEIWRLLDDFLVVCDNDHCNSFLLCNIQLRGGGGGKVSKGRRASSHF